MVNFKRKPLHLVFNGYLVKTLTLLNLYISQNSFYRRVFKHTVLACPLLSISQKIKSRPPQLLRPPLVLGTQEYWELSKSDSSQRRFECHWRWCVMLIEL